MPVRRRWHTGESEDIAVKENEARRSWGLILGLEYWGQLLGLEPKTKTNGIVWKKQMAARNGWRSKTWENTAYSRVVSRAG